MNIVIKNRSMDAAKHVFSKIRLQRTVQFGTAPYISILGVSPLGDTVFLLASNSFSRGDGISVLEGIEALETCFRMEFPKMRMQIETAGAFPPLQRWRDIHLEGGKEWNVQFM